MVKAMSIPCSSQLSENPSLDNQIGKIARLAGPGRKQSNHTFDYISICY